MNTIVQLRPQQDDLFALTEVARSAAVAARQALLFDTKEARREIYLAYGHALIPIKQRFGRNDRGFNHHLKAHGLEVSTPGFRSDTMWLARNWSDGLCLQNSVNMCPHSNPCDIRSWWRERRRREPDRQTLFDPLIKPTDNWNFSTVRFPRINGESGHGYIPGDLYANCLWYWTKPDDVVVAPMAGSGQIHEVYERRNEWMRPNPWNLDLHLFDLSPQQPEIRQNDLTQGIPIDHADYIIMDLPYYGMVKGQYSNDPKDLANQDIVHWSSSITDIAITCSSVQQTGGLCTVVSPNFRNVNSGIKFMATRCIQNSFERVNYILYDIAYASRRIQQTQTPAMAALNNAAKQHKVMLTDISEILTFTKL